MKISIYFSHTKNVTLRVKHTFLVVVKLSCQWSWSSGLQKAVCTKPFGSSSLLTQIPPSHNSHLLVSFRVVFYKFLQNKTKY